MDYNRIKTILAILGMLTLIALSFFVGRNSVKPIVNTEVKWDTIRIEKIVPKYIDKVRTEYVYVNTTTDKEKPDSSKKDSTLVEVDIERRTYEDERYRAVVSGPTIGGLHPALDQMEIFQKTETVVIETKPPLFRPYIRGSVGENAMGLGAGVSIRDRVDVDVQYMRMNNKNMMVVGANFRFNVDSK